MKAVTVPVNFVSDFLNRLVERETLVVIGAFVLLYLGKVDSIEAAVAMATTVVALVGGRSYVKGEVVKENTAVIEAATAVVQADSLNGIPIGSPLPRGYIG